MMAMATARGCDPLWAASLLPAIEAGLVESLRETQDEADGPEEEA